MKKRAWLIVNSAIVFVCLIGLWASVVAMAHFPVYMLPGPGAVLAAAWERYPSLLNSLWITTIEAVGGLAASIVVGIAAALLFAQWRWMRQLVYPYTILLQTVPIVAIAPLIINWVGPGISAVMLVTFIICLAPIIANTTQGLISVDRNLIDLFLMHKAAPAQVLLKLKLPHALPNLFTGIRISAGIAVIGGITGELFAGSTRVGEGGLGYSIIYANNQMETGYMFALVAAATLLGFGFFFLVMFFEWLALHHWHESTRETVGE
ncbi:ABC transporter permease [Terracidiphilus sp.]|jgi:NitT/TauT family transport system permease protein|uniref:ABC transporter permease n=1 Tax=Terracidiphilus sp. TaxID=1964191 RepID=UPI003C27B553